MSRLLILLALVLSLIACAAAPKIHNEGKVAFTAYPWEDAYFGQVEVAAGHKNAMVLVGVDTFMDRGFLTSHGPDFHPDRVAYTFGARGRYGPFTLDLVHICNHKVDARGFVFQGEYLKFEYEWGR